jgi:hypothetical protein
MTAPQLAETSAQDAGPPARRLVGAGAYSIRLADIDAALDTARLVHAEISERLDGIERVTNETHAAVTTLMESIRRHPLLSKFIGGK